MGRFDKIDLLLDELADQLQAKLSKDRPGIPDDLKFEERRLDWSEGNLNKAIIIQPNLKTGINYNLWNFINVAWVDKIISGRKPKSINYIVENKEFTFIEENIEMLISKSIKHLSSISESNLKF